jgi:hypothetical protein
VNEKVIQDIQTTEDVRASQEDTIQAGEKSPVRLKIIQALFETGLIITGLIAIYQLLPRQLFGDGAVRYFRKLASTWKPFQKRL